ncbi:hypothetical protein P0M11_07225 [Kaistella sp. PBT33-4]|nr:hypothetical protein [Kaistella sp. PBT33-4]
MKKCRFIILVLITLISCESDAEKFDNEIKSKIHLKQNEKLIYFEKIKSDSISLRQIDNFIANNAYQALIHINKEQNRIGSDIKNMDTAKTVEAIKNFQRDFNYKMKTVSDSFQYYNKILDASIDSRKSQRKVIKIIDCKYIIQNENTKEKTDLRTTVFIDGEKVFLHPQAFFNYKAKKINEK